IRFAVLAGLARKGFEPKNRSPTNYFLWPHPADIRSSTVPAQSREAAGETKAAISGPQETVIPYEWVGELSQRSQEAEKLVLVVWLNEQDFRGEPFRKLSELEQFLHSDERRTGADASFKLIGPYSSAVLRDMVAETRTFTYAPPYDKAFGRLWGHD